MLIETQLVEVLKGAQEGLMRLLKSLSSLEDMERCLEVAKDLAQLRAKVEGSSAEGASESRDVASSNDQEQEDGFRYEVNSQELSRIGKLAAGGEYYQNIPRHLFLRVVEEVGKQMASGITRVKAKTVADSITNLPYYQVNMSVTYLRDRGQLNQPVRSAKDLVARAQAQWDKDAEA